MISNYDSGEKMRRRKKQDDDDENIT